ncbi:MAG TPA: flagellar basal-body rod protein FlgF [Bryobacterales bacterium]|nr:flagellar basal-body rod protein FlgF [Bryobacterales bacterium]
MDQSLLTAAAGMQARLETLDLISNNIANVATAGYKADHEFYDLFLGAEAEADTLGDVTWMPVVEGSAVDFRQAALTSTGGPLDVALDGPGFFAVQGPQGQPLYTRNGSFQRTSDGQLVTADGLPVQGVGGPLTLPPGIIQIAEDGTVSVGEQNVGRLQVVEFPDPRQLVKVGHNYFRPAAETPPGAPAGAPVRQGRLESANVNPAEAAVRLVEVTRQFEMLARAANLVANEVNKQAIQQIPGAGQ